MKKSMGLFILLCFVAIAGTGLAASDTTELEDVVVTATKMETSLENIGGSSVTVITAEDIAAKQQFTVEEVLKGVPGLDIVANGGLGTMSNVFSRGADSKNTLILVDGVMYNDPSSANRTANLANLTIDSIERIEVVRGPLSVLYGSNATAGVVNIITKKGKGDPSLYAGTEYGSYNTWKAYGGASAGMEKFNFSIAASRTDTDGYSIANDENDDIPHDGNTDEEDGWENTTLNGKFGFDVTEDFDLNLTLRYQDSEVEGDEYASGYAGDRFGGWPDYAPEPDGDKKERTESSDFIYRADVHNYFFDRFLESTLYYQGSYHDRDAYDNDGAEDYEYNGSHYEAGWQGALNFQDWNVLSLGIGYYEEKFDNKSQWSEIPEQEAHIGTYWLQDQILLWESFVVIAGLRYDDHKEFGGEATYRLSPAYTYQPTETTVKASYGTGYRAPSLFELYSSYGNEDLDPEKSRSWDFGVEQKLLSRTISFGITYFNMVFDDYIDYDFATSMYQQAEGETDTAGVETFVQWMPFENLDFGLNYTYTHTEDPDGSQLARRPYNKVSFNTRYRFLEKAMVNLDVYWVDERRTNDSATDEDGNHVDSLDAYTLVNLSASYDLTDYLQLYGRIDNLFDTDYEEAWSYATPGFSAYAGIKVHYN